MEEEENEKRSHGQARPWRALYDWFRKGVPPSYAGGDVGTRTDANIDRGIPDRIGRYSVLRKLGEGGMGVVYAARDERLERTVAVKVMSLPENDETARARFLREAKAAASVNHPNICQLYEIGEDEGRLFIAMELLEGESLADRLRRGPMNVADTMSIGLGMLAALSAIHARGIVHRDLKPSNVILTPHGVKLLDFGLARATSPESSPSPGAAVDLTRTGMLVGTPGYMAPERVNGEPADARTDLFAVGAVLFEMLAGRPAFRGRSVVEVLHAVLHEQPPALSGSPAAAAMDRVIRRALAKEPSQRPQSADEMAESLRDAERNDGTQSRTVEVRPLTRLVVLPFRMLRPDPDTDFLAFSLPDAIATSLSSLDSLLVRSSATAARFAGDVQDFHTIASAVDVDRVVLGTLMRSADQLRATVQLVDAPGGALLTSETVQVPLGDLFQLQDDLARRIVNALSLPLVGSRTPPTPVTPPDDRAYLLYLQANEKALRYERLPEARELYERCLEVDPSFAPAWARLGRCHWMIGRYIQSSEDSEARAEEALRRALDLNPRLSLAHKFYAHLEAGTGQCLAALVRLLGQAERHGTDPELFAGLVQVCRYCGLFEEAVAAHEEARRLDPNVPTSIGQTLLVKGDLVRLQTDESINTAVAGADGSLRAGAYGFAGDRDEARRVIEKERAAAGNLPAFDEWSGVILAWLDRKPEELVARFAKINDRTIMDDPEALFQCGWFLCDAGGHAPGMELLRRAVFGGYYPAPTLAWSNSFDPLRKDPAFTQIVAQAEAGRAQAATVFRERGGTRILGR